jgi:hypothetical protein
MSVYFVHCQATDAVKIGFADDARKRFSKIQSDSPGDLRLLAVEDGGREREAELHARFAGARRRGEWFEFAPALREYVGGLPAIKHGRKRAPLKGKLGEWLVANNMTMQQFANAIGTTKGSISEFCAGHTIPRHDLMVRIYEATRGEVQPNHFYDLPEIDQ